MQRTFLPQKSGVSARSEKEEAGGAARSMPSAALFSSGPVQKMELDEDELPVQGKFVAQKMELDKDDELPVQGKFAVQRKENKTGLPDGLKTGVESLSGFSMDDVKVHYNSDKPSQLQAHAYAQGTDIHLAPGQEQHLPHEAWHVAQQKQGRVQPTMQMKGAVPVNDDRGLESEADLMGARAAAMQVPAVAESAATQLKEEAPVQRQAAGVIQRFDAGVGAGWHIHYGEHIKYASNNATRVNFTGRSRRQIGYALEGVIQGNGLAGTKADADFIACKTWIRNNIA